MKGLNPFKIQNFLSDKSIQKPKELTTHSKNGFSFKVKNNEELNLLSKITIFEIFSCEFTFHKFLN